MSRTSARARRVGVAGALAALAAGLALAVPAQSAPSVAGDPIPYDGKNASPSKPNASMAEVQGWEAGLRSYFVITDPAKVAAGKAAVTAAGGTVFSSYDAIGVIVAHSSSASFASTVRGNADVQQVGATRTSDVPQEAYAPTIPASPSQSTPTASETNRWDMTQINADDAWAIDTGSTSVTVGVLDTGVDDQHYDLKSNFDAANSASCAYGKSDARVGAWRDTDQHGTHVAGTIAAAKNGKGMIGVAPTVKIASVRIAETPSGLFFPENTVCAFMWSGDHDFEVTNNSYYTDPWMYLCPTNADQKAITEGIQRATAYAEGKGVVHVAAAGNDSQDLANKTSDSSSPNDSTPVNRSITSDCLDVPTELPGVVTVSSLTSTQALSSFSNYGLNKIDVAAPGSSVYSTVPGGGYATLSGTSMASPHAAGVAALLSGEHPDWTPAQIRDALGAQAINLNNATKFGSGEVDALKAVQSGTGNTVTVTNPGAKTGTVGTAASLQITASSSGAGETLTYSATGLPAGLAINATTGLISGTPTTAGTYNVTATAKDSTQATGSTTFTWTISTGTATNILTNGVPVTGISGARGSATRYTLNVPAGATGLRFTLAGGTGDADLYVRFGTAPTTSVYDCRSWSSTNTETCSITTARAGTYHVLIQGYAAFSGVTLTGRFTQP
jgi:subtilisin family serine protease